MRDHFDRELQRLQEDLLVMSSIVEEALTDSVECLRRRDMEGAQRLVAQDCQINGRRYAIEADALALIAMQQPMAGDLRVLAAVLDIAAELERIADYAKGIARITLMLGESPSVEPPGDILIMAAKARSMLHRALGAFLLRDVERARAVPREDDEVDALYDRIYRALIARVITDPNAMDQANHLLWVAHNLERAADRVSNICERVIFTVTGELVDLDTECTA